MTTTNPQIPSQNPSQNPSTAPKLASLITMALLLTKEDQVALVTEVAKAANLKVVLPGQATTKKWATAQAFYEAMVARTDRAVGTYKALAAKKEANALELGVKAMMGTKEFEAEVVDFSDKGRERLKGELARMVRKFAKDANVDYEKVLKAWS